jgi:hypothetical protein
MPRRRLSIYSNLCFSANSDLDSVYLLGMTNPRSRIPTKECGPKGPGVTSVASHAYLHILVEVDEEVGEVICNLGIFRRRGWSGGIQ